MPVKTSLHSIKEGGDTSITNLADPKNSNTKKLASATTFMQQVELDDIPEEWKRFPVSGFQNNSLPTSPPSSINKPMLVKTSLYSIKDGGDTSITNLADPKTSNTKKLASATTSMQHDEKKPSIDPVKTLQASNFRASSTVFKSPVLLMPQLMQGANSHAEVSANAFFNFLHMLVKSLEADYKKLHSHKPTFFVNEDTKNLIQGVESIAENSAQISPEMQVEKVLLLLVIRAKNFFIEHLNFLKSTKSFGGKHYASRMAIMILRKIKQHSAGDLINFYKMIDDKIQPIASAIDTINIECSSKNKKLIDIFPTVQRNLEIAPGDEAGVSRALRELTSTKSKRSLNFSK